MKCSKCGYRIRSKKGHDSGPHHNGDPAHVEKGKKWGQSIK